MIDGHGPQLRLIALRPHVADAAGTRALELLVDGRVARLEVVDIMILMSEPVRLP